jgi:hypothetical protein
MKKMIVAGLALVLSIPALCLFSTGCGGGNSPAAPVTVVPQPTPGCGAEYGYYQNGGSNSTSNNYFYAVPVTLVAAKTLSMSLHVSSATGNIVLFVYSDNSGAPGTFLDAGTITSPVNSTWNTAALTGVNLPAGVYWIGWESQNTNYFYSDGAQQGPFFSLAQTFGLPPSTMPAGTVTSNGFYRAGIILSTVCQ